MGRLFDSKQFRDDLSLSGSFSGSFEGNGSGLTNIPASGIVGLNLSQIASGSATASISPYGGLQINTGVGITGSLILHNFGGNTAGGSSIVTGFESFADNQSLAVGGNVSASGGNTVAFGQLTRAQALASVVQGYNSVVESNPIPPYGTIQAAYAHAEGWETSASAWAAHAEGYQTQAGSVNYNLPPTAFGPDVGRYSHAEGWQTKAFGESSHAEGKQTQAGYVKFFSPLFYGVGDFSHAEGIGTIASGSGQHAQGKYNTHGNDTSLMIIGNGTDDLNRSDLALFNTNGIVFNQPLTASIVSSSFVGDGSGLTGIISSSYAISASYAVSSSHEIIKEVSSSYADTASFAQSGNGVFSGSFSGSFQGDGSGLTGIDPFPFSGSAVITGSLVVSGSATPIEVIGSGSRIFSVQGSLGELFAIDDQLSGSLLVVNDISGLPQFEVFSDGRTLIGADPRSLYTSATISSTTLNVSQSIYSLSTSSYDGVFFDYTVVSASNARAGNIMSIWNGGNLVYTENTTTDIGSTVGVTFNVEISQSQAQLISLTDTAGWKIKTTIRSI